MIDKNLIKLTKYVTPIFQTQSTNLSEWFGYYNYDTLNYNQSSMLCNRIDCDGMEPQKAQNIELGYYELASGNWHHIGFSDSWNWQQGAMMQWFKENSVIYNCSRVSL